MVGKFEAESTNEFSNNTCDSIKNPTEIWLGEIINRSYRLFLKSYFQR